MAFRGVRRVARRTLLLGATALVLSADRCDDDKKRGESQINGDVSVSFSDDGGIVVRVLGRDQRTETDSAGNFSLEDRVAGPLTLLFDRSDGVSADLDVPPFPRGSILQLDDIEIDRFDSRATYGAASVSFAGHVTAVDCAETTIFVAGKVEPRDGEFAVRTGDARISNRNDDVVNCSAVAVGDAINLRGRLEREGAITRATVTDHDLPR